MSSKVKSPAKLPSPVERLATHQKKAARAGDCIFDSFGEYVWALFMFTAPVLYTRFTPSKPSPARKGVAAHENATKRGRFQVSNHTYRVLRFASSMTSDSHQGFLCTRFSLKKCLSEIGTTDAFWIALHCSVETCLSPNVADKRAILASKILGPQNFVVWPAFFCSSWAQRFRHKSQLRRPIQSCSCQHFSGNRNSRTEERGIISPCVCTLKLGIRKGTRPLLRSVRGAARLEG